MNTESLLSKEKIGVVGCLRISFSIAPFISTLICILTFGAAIAPTFQIQAVAWFVDDTIQVVQKNIPIGNTVLSIVILFSLIFYQWMVQPLMNMFWLRLKERMVETYRVDVVTHRAKLRYMYTEDAQAMDTMTRVTKEAENEMIKVLQTLCQFVSLVLRVAGIIYIILLHSWWVALILIVAAVPLLFLSKKSGDAQYQVHQENTKHERKYNYLSEVLRGREVVQERALFGFTKPLNQKWNEVYRLSSKFIQTSYRNWYVKLELGSILTALLSMMSAAILLFPAINGAMTVGVYVSLVNACFRLIDVMSWEMRNTIDSFAQCRGYLKDLNTFLRYEEKPGILQDKEKNMTFQSIRFENVSFNYPNSDNYVLKNLNMTIKNGVRYAIVGKNGEGKTTITKLLLGLYENYEGNIYVDDVELRDLNPAEAKSLYAVVYQDFNTYQLSLKENIQLGSLKKMSDQEILEILSMMSMEDLIARLPDWANTPLGRIFEEGQDISGGQWQRIAIARCAASQSPIRILDEPTAALDPLMESKIYTDFSKISNNGTVIMISHRLGSTKLADEILVLDAGKIVESGNHEELIKIDGQYKEMFEQQKRWYE